MAIESLLTKGVLITDLAGKVVEELGNPRQFIDPVRRTLLWEHGKRYLRSFFKRIDINTELIADNITQSLNCYQDDSGLLGFFSPKTSAFAVVLPKHTQLKYFRHGSVKADDNPKLVIAGPTTDFAVYASSEGYRDSEGFSVPFAERKENSWVQHGGIFIRGDEGTPRIMDYSQFVLERDKPLSGGEIAMEANWYMDSENQQRVASRRNLRVPKPYNCIGILVSEEGERRFFTINNDLSSRVSMKTRFGIEHDNNDYSNITMREIAAFSNVLAKRLSAERWAIVGLEYNGGGTYSGLGLAYNFFGAYY